MKPLLDHQLPRFTRTALISALVIGLYFLEHEFGVSLTQWVAPPSPGGWPRLLAYTFLYYGIWLVLVPILAAALIVGGRQSLAALGLNASIWTALKIGLASTAILPLSYFFMGPLNLGDILYRVWGGSVLPGIGEEIFFRGMLFGLLFRFAGWGFLPAALFGALVFGVGHLYQGNTLGELVGVFGITAIGALWWAWVYIEWDHNLWMPVSFHVLMNMYFALFDVAENAFGGIAFIAIRAVVVLISILLTIRHAKSRGYFRITRGDLLWRGSVLDQDQSSWNEPLFTQKTS